jgi:hypothetical protein
MFILDVLVLALHAVICPNPGVERLFIDTQVTCRLGNGLLRLHREFHGARFKRSRIAFRYGFTHRPHLSSGTSVLVSVCPGEYSHINLAAFYARQIVIN